MINKYEPLDSEDIEFAHSVLQRAVVLVAVYTDRTPEDAADIMKIMLNDTDFKVWSQEQYEMEV